MIKTSGNLKSEVTFLASVFRILLFFPVSKTGTGNHFTPLLHTFVSNSLFVRIFTAIILCSYAFLHNVSGQATWTTVNPFEQKVFIENKGQFSPPPTGMPVSPLGIKWFDGLKGQGVIKYACNIGGVCVLFTEKGLTYSHTESVPMTEEEKEIAKKNLPAAAAQESEEEEEENLMSYIPHFLYMNWIGANPDVKIVAEDMVTEYFTYANPADTSGKTGIKALAYKKILYKNIYPDIDVEYTLPDSTPLSFRRGVGGEVGGEAGIKYSIILHPGADASLIKMQYSEPTPSPSGEGRGEVILEKGKEGEVIIKTSFGDFIDHAPVSYYEEEFILANLKIKKNREKISSAFELSGNTVSFALNLSTPNSPLTTPDSLLITPNSLLPTPDSLLTAPDSLLLTHGSIIIDPWTTFPSFTYSSTNSAYDIDYDNNGNVYVFGGKSDPGPTGSTWQVKKFNSSGAIQWTYTCTPYGGNDGVYYGDFCVNRATGSSYIISKVFHYSFAATIDKVNSAGAYVNRISDSYSGTEWWRIVYNTSTNNLIVGGGGPTYAYQGYIIDTNLTAVNYINVLGAGDVFHDIALLAVDNANNCYMATSCSFYQSCYGSYNNVMLKVSGSTLSPIAWSVSDGYSLTETSSVRYIDPPPASYCNLSEAIGMNGMAVSNNYLYTYDAATLKKWDKNTGALISSVNVSSLLTGQCINLSTFPPTFYTVPCVVTWGGIAVDKCDNIYVGVNNTVKTYDVNLNLISTTNVTNTVYDLAIGPVNNLYACGSAYVSLLGSICDALPIELLSFTGNCLPSPAGGAGVRLNWQTASETNNDYFTLERSADAVNWIIAGTVKGAGNSSTLLNYEFTDEISQQLPASDAATLYYRLKQTDYDGKFEYSGLISVSCSPPDNWQLILQNIPASDELSGTLYITEDTNVTIDIIDMFGKKIMSHQLSASKGSNLLRVDLKNVSSGVYIVKVYCNQNSVQDKFMKK